MDKDRQIRFLFPPIFLLVFIVIAVWKDPKAPKDLRRLLPNFLHETDNEAVSNLNARVGTTVDMSSNLFRLAANLSSQDRNSPLSATNLQALVQGTSLLASDTAVVASNLISIVTTAPEVRRGETGLDDVVKIVVAGGALTLVLGWAIGAIGLFILRTGFLGLSFLRYCFRKMRRDKWEFLTWLTDYWGNHEACLPERTARDIDSHIVDTAKVSPEHPLVLVFFLPDGTVRTQTHNPEPSAPSSPARAESALDPSDVLSAAATFDHEFLAEGVHLWLLRRWNSFTTAANSCVALVLACVFVHVSNIRPPDNWRLILWALFVVFALHGLASWRQTMKMLRYQARRPKGSFKNCQQKDERGQETFEQEPPEVGQ